MRNAFFGFWIMVFLLFMYWQFNDVDPFLWVPIYLLASVMNFTVLWRPWPKGMYLFVALCYLVAAVMYWPGVYEGIGDKLEMKTENQEYARESLGLGICALSMIFCAIGARKLKVKS